MLILFLLLLLPCVKSQACEPVGEWTAWTQWTPCPEEVNSPMNFRTRIRTCEPRPVGCKVEKLYSCRGSYSEIAYCGFNSTTNSTTIAVGTAPTDPSPTSKENGSWSIEPESTMPSAESSEVPRLASTLETQPANNVTTIVADTNSTHTLTSTSSSKSLLTFVVFQTVPPSPTQPYDGASTVVSTEDFTTENITMDNLVSTRSSTNRAAELLLTLFTATLDDFGSSEENRESDEAIKKPTTSRTSTISNNSIDKFFTTHVINTREAERNTSDENTGTAGISDPTVGSGNDMNTILENLSTTSFITQSRYDIGATENELNNVFDASSSKIVELASEASTLSAEVHLSDTTKVPLATEDQVNESNMRTFKEEVSTAAAELSEIPPSYIELHTTVGSSRLSTRAAEMLNTDEALATTSTPPALQYKLGTTPQELFTPIEGWTSNAFKDTFGKGLKSTAIEILRTIEGPASDITSVALKKVSTTVKEVSKITEGLASDSTTVGFEENSATANDISITTGSLAMTTMDFQNDLCTTTKRLPTATEERASDSTIAVFQEDANTSAEQDYLTTKEELKSDSATVSSEEEISIRQDEDMSTNKGLDFTSAIADFQYELNTLAEEHSTAIEESTSATTIDNSERGANTNAEKISTLAEGANSDSTTDGFKERVSDDDLSSNEDSDLTSTTAGFQYDLSITIKKLLTATEELTPNNITEEIEEGASTTVEEVSIAAEESKADENTVGFEERISITSRDQDLTSITARSRYELSVPYDKLSSTSEGSGSISFSTGSKEVDATTKKLSETTEVQTYISTTVAFDDGLSNMAEEISTTISGPASNSIGSQDKLSTAFDEILSTTESPVSISTTTIFENKVNRTAKEYLTTIEIGDDVSISSQVFADTGGLESTTIESSEIELKKRYTDTLKKINYSCTPYSARNYSTTDSEVKSSVAVAATIKSESTSYNYNYQSSSGSSSLSTSSESSMSAEDLQEVDENLKPIIRSTAITQRNSIAESTSDDITLASISTTNDISLSAANSTNFSAGKTSALYSTFNVYTISVASVTESQNLTNPETTHVYSLPDSSTISVESTESLRSNTTTAPTACNECSELNIHLYDDDNYMDGASVLNRYTVEGCKFVQFFCRPFEYGDDGPVKTVFNKNHSIVGLPLNVQVACRNGAWIDEQRGISVESLSCIYERPTTTTKITTTYAPGDPNNPCNQCTQDLYVTPMAGQEGSTYMDFRYEKCLTVQIYCQPTKPNMQVDLLENGRSATLNGATINRTFECTDDTEWVDTTSQLLVGNVTCLMKDGSIDTTARATTIGSSNSSTTISSIVKQNTSDGVTLTYGQENTGFGEIATNTTPLEFTVTALPEEPGVATNGEKETSTNFQSSSNSEINYPTKLSSSIPETADNLEFSTTDESVSTSFAQDTSSQKESTVAASTLLFSASTGEGSTESAQESVEITSIQSSAYMNKSTPLLSVTEATSVSEAAPPATPQELTSWESSYDPTLHIGISTAVSDTKLTESEATIQDLRTTDLSNIETSSFAETPSSFSSAVTVSTLTETAPLSMLPTKETETTIRLTEETDRPSGIVSTIGSGVETTEQSETSPSTTSTLSQYSSVATLPISDYDTLATSNEDADAETATTARNIAASDIPSTTKLFKETRDFSTTPGMSTLFASSHAVMSATSQFELTMGSGITETGSSVTETETARFTTALSTVAMNLTVEDETLASSATPLEMNETTLGGVSETVSLESSVDNSATENGDFSTKLPMSWSSRSTTTGLREATTNDNYLLDQTTLSRTDEIQTISTTPANVTELLPISVEFDTSTPMSTSKNIVTGTITIFDSSAINVELSTKALGLESTVTANSEPLTINSLSTLTSSTSFTEATEGGTTGTLNEPELSIATLMLTSSRQTTSGELTFGTTTTNSETTFNEVATTLALVTDQLHGTSMITESNVVLNPTSSSAIETASTTEEIPTPTSAAPNAGSSGETTAISSIITTASVATTTTTTKTSAARPASASTTADALTESATAANFDGCLNCQNVAARAMAKPGSYNGMMVLDHTADNNGCKHVEVNCVPTTAGENATLYVNEKDAVLSGIGSHLLRLSCNKEKKWVTDEGVVVSNVSCLVSFKSEGFTELPETVTEITTTTTMKPPPFDAVPCASCPRLSVVPLTSEYNNGFITLLTSTDGACKIVELTCEGNNTTDELAVLISGTVLEQGIGSLNMNLTCNDMMTWTTTNGYAVPHISCGIKITAPASTLTTSSITNSTMTIAAMTTTATTTATNSNCGQCLNIQPIPAPSLLPNEANGMLVLDHYYEFFSGCRVVVIRCSADTGYENATILFNGKTESVSAPERLSSSLTCTPEGRWKRLDEEITSTACRIAKKSRDVTPWPIVTTAPTTTTTTSESGSAPCSNCNRQLVTSVPSNYTNGFLTMDTYSTDICINVALSCSAPDGTSEVALIDGSGTYLSKTAATANLTLLCTNRTVWTTPSGTEVNSLSCAVIKPTTEPPITTTATLTTTTTQSPCTSSKWAEWREWSNCTDTCGSCGTMQRFRACEKSSVECFCEGSAFEKVVCNQDVCRYPREKACCDGFTPASYNGKFYCMKMQ